jgi:glutamine amidotransferase
MITIIDHDLGNTGSVVRAMRFLGIDFELSSDLKQLEQASKIILPGVGSYKAASEQILTPAFLELIKYKVLDRQAPFFGFCLGMQLLTDIGEEQGESKGLGLISGKTKKLAIESSIYKIPHMGWNDVQGNSLQMFKGVPENSCFYFVHSFEVLVSDTDVKQAFVDYGGKSICAAVEKDNIWGAQFHPEKSQKVGLQVLKNFCEL